MEKIQGKAIVLDISEKPMANYNKENGTERVVLTFQYVTDDSQKENLQTLLERLSKNTKRTVILDLASAEGDTLAQKIESLQAKIGESTIICTTYIAQIKELNDEGYTAIKSEGHTYRSFNRSYIGIYEDEADVLQSLHDRLMNAIEVGDYEWAEKERKVVDLIIIGAGPGGYETAVRAAKAGLQVVVIEKEHLGGTCLNAGCIPTKCLCHSAEDLTPTLSQGEGEDPSSYLAAAIARKNEVVEKLKAGVAQLMKTPGITLVEGEARFSPTPTLPKGEGAVHTIEVVHDSPEGERRDIYSAPNIIIATGSVTKFLPIPGAHAEGVVTSTELLNLTTLPQRLAIIGGGVIGLEFASIFQALGSQVTVIEFCKEVLPNFDRDLAKRLRSSLKKRGIEFHTNAAAKEISPLPTSPKGEENLIVHFEEKGKLQSLEADLVLMAVGRAANLDALNLNDVGIETTPRGIVVDEYMQTNVPGIYAIGDVNGIMQLAHAASAQGKVALKSILNSKFNIQYSKLIVPSAVFTVPEAAMVGQTEEQLEEAGIEYQTHKAMYRANGKALAMEADDGLVKILTDTDGKILGCHILGAHASDLIHEVTLAMRLGATIHDIADTVHAHPSLSEILMAAAEA